MSDTLEFPEIEPTPAQPQPPAGEMLLEEFRKLAAQMKEIVGDAAETDQKLWHDLLEGQTDAPDKLCSLIDQALVRESQALGLKQAIERYQGYIAKLDAEAKAFRATAKSGMQILELKSLRAPNFRANLGDGRPSVDVFDMNKLPMEYKKVETTAKRDMIGEAIKAGTTVPGAKLNPPSLVLRVTQL